MSDSSSSSSTEDEFIPVKKPLLKRTIRFVIGRNHMQNNKRQKPNDSAMNDESTVEDADNGRPTVTIDEIIYWLSDTEWFTKLSTSDRLLYVHKIMCINEKDQKLPSIKDILCLKVNSYYIKELYAMRMKIDSINIMDKTYDIVYNQIITKYNFFAKLANKGGSPADLELPGDPSNTSSMIQEIQESRLEPAYKKILYKKILGGDCSASQKTNEWIRTALDLPHDRVVFKNVENTLRDLSKSLDEHLYGMQEVKDEIVMNVMGMLMGKTKYKSLGLCAPPGVGKTMLVRVLANALGLPMYQISLGGITDSSVLEGHSFTYVGSRPGLMVKGLINMGCTNGIIFFDEIDKISKTHNGKEVEDALLHIVDFTQNHEFRDKYLSEIPVDLSDIFFIYSMNSTDDINKTLLSRIPIINLPGYNLQQRYCILMQHILPDILKETSSEHMRGFTIDDFPHEIATYFITRIQKRNDLPDECGVRELLFATRRLISRIALNNLNGIKFELNRAYIDKLFPMNKAQNLSYYT